MNVTVLLVSNVLIYVYVAVLVAIRRLPAGHLRSALAGVTGAVLGFLFGIAVARSFLDDWSIVVPLVGLILAVNTSAVSLIFTNPVAVEKMRMAAEKPDPGRGWQRPLPRSLRLFRGWYRLSAKWKVAHLSATVWLLVSVAITLNTTAVGDPPPPPVRAVDALLTIGAWAVGIVAIVKAWRLGRSVPQGDANQLS